MAVFLESDFWPNLIYLTARSNVPTVLASSQMSQKSARFWTGLGYFLAKKIFSQVTQVLAVDPKQELLFKKLGAPHVKSLTSLKSIAEKPPVNENYIRNLKKYLIKKVLLAASTHPVKELMINTDLLRKQAHDDILIIIAPRHIKEVLLFKIELKLQGLILNLEVREFLIEMIFYLSDTMGEMGSLIEVADLVYVRVMVPVGGHSPSEASNLANQ